MKINPGKFRTYSITRLVVRLQQIHLLVNNQLPSFEQKIKKKLYECDLPDSTGRS